jgi:SAM-dependent methyltransferase
MSDADRRKWDKRYAAGSHSGVERSCEVLARHIGLAPAGTALDLACGTGRNALYLAQRGYRVDAVDISSVGLQRGREIAQAEKLPIQWHCMDLLDDPELPGTGYSLILMCHFMAADLLSCMPQLLQPGGVLMVEQHMLWPQPVAGGLAGPGSERFRVAPGGLAGLLEQTLPRLDILVREEGLVRRDDGAQVALSMVVAQRPGKA